MLTTLSKKDSAYFMHDLAADKVRYVNSFECCDVLCGLGNSYELTISSLMISFSLDSVSFMMIVPP